MGFGDKTRNVHLHIHKSVRKCIFKAYKETKSAGEVTEAWSRSRQLWQQDRGGLGGEWLQW